jgi:hypothetical protein
MSQLHFEKLSKYDRPQEPASVSIPFAQGTLTDPDRLRILDDGQPLPAQKRVLATWPDKSVKWLLAHLQPDLPGNAARTLSFAVVPGPDGAGNGHGAGHPAPTPAVTVTVREDDHAITVDTGPLQFSVPRTGYLPIRDVHLNGQRLWEEPFSGFSMTCGGERLSTAGSDVTVEVEEAGPLRAVILVRGKHVGQSDQPRMELHGRITAHANKPYIEVEHAFYHTEDEGTVELSEVGLRFAPQVAAAAATTAAAAGGEPPPGAPVPQLSVAEGYGCDGTQVQQGTDPLEVLVTGQVALHHSFEGRADTAFLDMWADWRVPGAGLCLSILQPHQNFPKKVRATSAGIECGLFPVEAPPAKLHQGMGKTHTMLLHFHDGAASTEELTARSLQFQLPDLPSLPRAWYRDNNPWVEDAFPAQIPDRVLYRFTRLHDSRQVSLGMFHFGDAPIGVAPDGTVSWLNNEYDRTHNCYLFYALTGERRALEAARTAARHWLDVDYCRRSDNPLRQGGLVKHCRGHVLGSGPTGNVIPSHQWVDGFLDYYHLTGRREALDAARSIVEISLHQLTIPNLHTSAREAGWALRAAVTMGLETHEEHYRTKARQIVDRYLKWQQDLGGMLAPYTSHSLPRVPFMIGVATNSLARYLRLDDDPEVQALVIETAGDLLENGLDPSGITYYKELPGLRAPAANGQCLETFTIAYHLTGDGRFLKQAGRLFAVSFENLSQVPSTPRRFLEEEGAIIGGGMGRVFSALYPSLITFVSAASPEVLARYEFPS